MTTRTLTRAELHTLVWSHPPREVAHQLRVTIGELDRLLEVMSVPYPYSGYWSKPGAAPRTVPKLPKRPPSAADAVEITPVLPRGPKSRLTLREEVGMAGAAEPGAPGGTPEEAGSTDNASFFPTRLVKPHRIIAARIAEEQQRRAEWKRMGLGGANETESAIARRMRRLEDLLYKAVERRGHKVEVERGSLYQVRLMVDGRSITYGLRERYRQRREPLSKEEAQESWNISMNRTHKTVRVMTGVLALTLDAGVWPKPQWEDKADHPLELQVEDIVSGAEAVAREAEEREAQRREEQRRYYEEQQRREASRLEALREENRWRRVRELAGKAEEARQVRALLSALEAELAQQDSTDSAREFLAWAWSRLEAFDPLASGALAIIRGVNSVTAGSYEESCG